MTSGGFELGHTLSHYRITERIGAGGTYGRPGRHVAETLNELLARRTVYTDGWVVDKPWLSRHRASHDGQTLSQPQVHALPAWPSPLHAEASR